MALIENYNIQKSKDFVYLRLKALIWADFGLEYPENLRSQSGQKVAETWRNNSQKRVVIVNCKGVSVIDQHALEDVKKHCPTAIQPIIFITDSSTFMEDIEHALGAPGLKLSLGEELVGYAYAKKISGTSRLKQLVSAGFGLEIAETKKVVGDCFEKHKGNQIARLNSTPIRSSGVFNARELIGNPKTFSLIALQLAERLELLIQKYRPRNPCILAVSLRGSPIAAAAAFLANPRLDVEIVDHMGPKQAVLEGYSINTFRSGLSYIYVGDFAIGGTEIKVASSYACALGSHVTNALMIGSLLESDEYGVSIPIESLVSLKECRKDVRYTFEK